MSTNASAALRWGFIGCGKISNDFVNALKCVPNAVLQACAARSLSSAQDFASQHGFVKAYDSYDALCQDPAVDVVYIGTLHTCHYAHSLLALNHNKHVLVEKPMTINAKQAEHVIKVAKDKQRFFMEGMWTRFFPATRHVRQLLKDKAIGDVHHVNADIGFYFPPDLDRIWDRTLGGGGLLDIGIYPLAFVTMVFGTQQPDRVSAVGKLSEGGVDIYGSLTLEYSNNRFATVQYTCLAEFGEAVTIIGTKGKIHIHTPAHTPTKVTTIRIGDDGQRHEQVSSFPLPEPAPSATNFNFGGSAGFLHEAEAVTECINAKQLESSEYPQAESFTLTRIMDAVRQQLGVVYPADASS
ncbi:TPA: hypothetical protein N0F65_007487 [Lagenidium giganteum]|uniref:D-xylose 1-dehydrogenase (NADP(+), D-xylono-1,5-lactone-forming) n=1 Tax=Lagenidium giganteum TaxID=4803 RepID=A0AAV2ZIK3_9STRA|nr:TPA: hypothetical protein N0F65_007487 [Lagenidium giganteum]